MAFRWRADDGPILAVFGSSLPSLTEEKNAVRVVPPLTTLSGSAHGCIRPQQPIMLVKDGFQRNMLFIFPFLMVQ